MKQLRQYQADLKLQAALMMNKVFKVLCQLPTGGGKTIIFTSITMSAISKGKTVLILTESRKIYRQIIAEFEKTTEIKAGVRDIYVIPGLVYVAMAQTLQRRDRILEQFRQLDKNLIVITDEVHVGSVCGCLNKLEDNCHLGFTATPNYKEAKHLHKFYKDIVVGPQVKDLQGNGFLAPYIHLARKSADLQELKINNMGEYSEESQEEAFGGEGLFLGLEEDLKMTPFKHGMIFTASIRHCKEVAKRLRESGYDCVEVHSEEPQSDYNLARFSAGEVSLCVSVGILTKGYDFPAIDLIALVRATTSLPLYLQMIGRGSRPFGGKSHFTVLDYGGNWGRFGLWNDDRDWSLLWKPLKEKKKSKANEGVMPIKDCPSCGNLVPQSLSTCSNCGYVWEKVEPNMQEGVLEEITNTMDELIDKKMSEITPEQLAMYVKLKNKKPYGQRIAKSREQSGEKGFLKAYGSAMGYKGGWYHFQMKTIDDEEITYFDNIITQ